MVKRDGGDVVGRIWMVDDLVIDNIWRETRLRLWIRPLPSWKPTPPWTYQGGQSLLRKTC
jgi:hypothetical protein